jgi:hypothetical protein
MVHHRGWMAATAPHVVGRDEELALVADLLTSTETVPWAPTAG